MTNWTLQPLILTVYSSYGHQGVSVRKHLKENAECSETEKQMEIISNNVQTYVFYQIKATKTYQVDKFLLLVIQKQMHKAKNISKY